VTDVGTSTPQAVALPSSDSLRRRALIAVLLVVIQSGIGVVVNLYDTVPNHHSGANPSDYFAGSYHSVLWAISSSYPALVIHSILGLLLVVMAISVAVHASLLHQRRVTSIAVLGGLFVIGAAFNGASFLDFAGKNISSLLMALLALGALVCYVLVVYLLPVSVTSHPQPLTRPSQDHWGSGKSSGTTEPIGE
jgi:hypothetical protein